MQLAPYSVSIVLAGISLSVAACEGIPEPADQVGTQLSAGRGSGLLPRDERHEIEPRLPDNWIGNDIGANPGTWRYAGRANMASPGTEATIPVLDSDAPSVPEPNRDTLIMRSGSELIELDIPDEDQRMIAEELTKRGFAEEDTAGVDGPREEEGDPWIQKGWSGNVDNRTPMSIAIKGTTTQPYRYIGQVKHNGTAQNADGFCGGTFIGNHGQANTGYVITAAHCVIDSVTGNWLALDFWPRQDRCLTETGGAVAGCDQGPYGEWDDAGGSVILWSYYAENCAGPGKVYGDACRANDIAVVRMHGTAGATYPGAMGFGYFYPNFLDTQIKYHRGYPNCNDFGDPAPASPKICLSRTLYGDGTFTKDGGSWFSGAFPRTYAVSSDNSGNHSGGPAYYSGGGYYVFGVMVTQSCVASNCGGATLVNFIRALDEGTYNATLTYMGL